MAKVMEVDVVALKAYLTRHIHEGDNVWFLLKHISDSGRRFYDVYMVTDDKEIRRITNSVSQLTDYKYDRGREALTIDGYGFNAMHEIADTLSLALFGVGDKLNYRDF